MIPHQLKKRKKRMFYSLATLEICGKNSGATEEKYNMKKNTIK
jgi:hypothetical protein